MSKHTKGPWSIEHIPGVDLGATAQITAPAGTGTPFDGKSIIVAEVWKTDDNIPRWSQDETGNANARLIAAAPDLLDACKTAIQQCTTLLVSQGWNERWDSITGGEWAGPVITNIMQAADAAIAKAEGGQQ